MRNVLLLALGMGLFACEGTGTGNPPVAAAPEGFVQKGPFVAGSSVTLRELTSELEATGRTFSTTIESDDGAFRFGKTQFESPYVELNSRGFFFHENLGELSSAPIELFALASLDDGTSVNVNLMGHLERERVRRLFDEGKDFAEAKRQAQSELLAAFSIDAEGLGNAETLDITKDDGAALLALSVILLADRPLAELTELLSRLTLDLADDGVIERKRLLELAEAVAYYDGASIRKKLAQRYADLGIDVSIPDFEKHVDAFIISMGANHLYCARIGSQMDSTFQSCSFDFSKCNDDGADLTIKCAEGACECTRDGQVVGRFETDDPMICLNLQDITKAQDLPSTEPKTLPAEYCGQEILLKWPLGA